MCVFVNVCVCVCVDVPSLTEEELDSMCPTAAAVAKIVKPGMKFMEVSSAAWDCSRSSGEYFWNERV